MNSDNPKIIRSCGRKVKNFDEKIWGIGINIHDAKKGLPWKGTNLLGKNLMKVRDRLKHII